MFWALHPDEIARNPVLLIFLIFKVEGPGNPTPHMKGPRSTRDSPEGHLQQNTQVLPEAQLQDEPDAVFLFAYRPDAAESPLQILLHSKASCAPVFARNGQQSGGYRSY